MCYGVPNSNSLRQVWYLGRAYTARDGTDLAAAKAYQNGLKATPLFPESYKQPRNLFNLAQAAVQAVVQPSAPGVRSLLLSGKFWFRSLRAICFYSASCSESISFVPFRFVSFLFAVLP